MKFTFSWLQDHLEPTTSFDEIVGATGFPPARMASIRAAAMSASTAAAQRPAAVRCSEKCPAGTNWVPPRASPTSALVARTGPPASRATDHAVRTLVRRLTGVPPAADGSSI